jgi:hypothetical protein
MRRNVGVFRRAFHAIRHHPLVVFAIGAVGSGSGTVGTLAGSGAGTVVAAITASGSGQVGTLAGSGTGTVHATIAGSGSGTVGTLAGTGSATVQASITATGSGQVGTLAGSGSGVVIATVTASGSGRVGTLAVTGVGLVAVPAVSGSQKFRQLEVFSTWPFGGGTIKATLREVTALRRVRTIGGTERWTLSVPLSATNFVSLQPGSVLRAWFEDNTFAEGLLTDDAAVVDDKGLASFSGAGIAAALAQCPPCISVDGDGVAALRFSSGPLTWAQHWSSFIQPAIAAGDLSFVVLGTSSPAQTFEISYDGTNPWDAIQAAATATGCEIDIRLVTGSSTYTVALVKKVNSGLTGGELRVLRNATVTRTRSQIPQATRVYFEGADGATMGEAVWKVSAKSGAVITLADPAGGAGPILADSQLVGFYLEAADRATRVLIGASSASAQTVTVSSGTAFTVGDSVRVRVDATGTRLIYLDHPVYVVAPPTGYGIKSFTLKRDDLPAIANLVPNATMAKWTGSSSTPPDSWAAVGGPTLTRTATIGKFQTGGQSCRVQSTADGQGLATPLFTIAPTAINPYGSGFVTYFLTTGAVRVELVATNGTATWIIPDGVQQVATDTSVGTFVTVGVAGIDLHALGATAVRLRIVQQGAGTADFYVDAAQYTETGGQQAFVDGSGCTQGWQAANAYLALNAPLNVRYDGSAIDFYRIDPVNYAAKQFVLGAQHPVVDEVLGYVDGVRVLELDENFLQESDTNVTLSSRPEDIRSLFSQLPPAPTAPDTANTPVVAGARTVTDAAVTASTATITSATAGFSALDVGKTLWVLSGKSDGTTLQTRIVSVTNATTATMADTVTVSRSGLTAVYGNANDVATLASSVGGARAGSALFNQNGQLTSAVTDAQARAVQTFLAKLLTIDPDTLDSVTDGVTYLKQIPLLVIAATQTGVTSTTVTATVVALDPTGGATPTITFDHGSSVTDNHDGTYTIARQASGSGPLNVLFTASKTGRQSASAVIVAPEQPGGPAGPSLTVTPTPASTSYSLAWSGTGTITLSIDGGSYATPGSSPITVTRDVPGGSDHVYAFKCVGADGSIMSESVTIPAQSASSALAGPSLTVSAQSTATTYVITWAATGTVLLSINGGTYAAPGTSPITVSRPAAGSADTVYAFKCTGADGTVQSDTVTVPAQQPTSAVLTVTSTPGSTSYSIAWSGTSPITLSIDGAAYATPPSSPITVSRNAPGGANKVYTFKGADGSTDTVSVPAQGVDAVTPDLTITPLTMTATTMTFRMAFTDPTGRHTPVCTATIYGSSGTMNTSLFFPYAMSDGTTYRSDSGFPTAQGWASGDTVTIDRPAFGSAPATIRFTADLTASGGGTEEVARTVLNQDGGQDLQVTATPGGSSYSIAWSGSSVQLSINGGSYSSPPSSPISVSLNAPGGGVQTYSFKGTVGSQAVTDTVFIPEKNLPALLTTASAVADPSNGWLAVSWELGYVPSGCYFKLYGFPGNGANVPSAADTWQAYSGNNISGATRSIHYVIDSEGLGPMLVCSFSNPGAAIHTWNFRLEVYDGSNVIQATIEFMTPFWGTPV